MVVKVCQNCIEVDKKFGLIKILKKSQKFGFLKVTIKLPFGSSACQKKKKTISLEVDVVKGT